MFSNTSTGKLSIWKQISGKVVRQIDLKINSIKPNTWKHQNTFFCEQGSPFNCFTELSKCATTSVCELLSSLSEGVVYHDQNLPCSKTTSVD